MQYKVVFVLYHGIEMYV